MSALDRDNFYAAWLERLFDAWRSANLDEIGRIFSNCKRYMEDPFQPIESDSGGIRRLWEEVKKQSDIILSGEVLVSTERAVTYRWHAKLSIDKVHEMDGVYFVRFDDDGKCIEFAQWTVEAEV